MCDVERSGQKPAVEAHRVRPEPLEHGGQEAAVEVRRSSVEREAMVGEVGEPLQKTAVAGEDGEPLRRGAREVGAGGGSGEG